MADKFLTLRQFSDLTLAEELAQLLKENNIPHFVEAEAFSFNPAFYDDSATKTYSVKVREIDFPKVTELMHIHDRVVIEEVDPEHYLLSFTDEELLEVVTKPDEWSAFDYNLALQLLQQRGKSVTEEQLNQAQRHRTEILETPDKPQTFWIAFGYIASVLGGVLGIFIGWHLSSHKRTLPTGQQVYAYNEHDRRHGRRILIISCIVAVICFVLRFANLLRT